MASTQKTMTSRTKTDQNSSGLNCESGIDYELTGASTLFVDRSGFFVRRDSRIQTVRSHQLDGLVAWIL